MSGPKALRPARQGDLACRIRAAGYVLTLWDITNDVGVPATQAILADPDGRAVFSGQGCHLDPTVALTRAILEAVQGRVAAVSGAMDTLEARVLQPAPEPATAAIFTAMGAEKGARAFPRKDLSGPTSDEDVRRILARLRAAGCSAAAMVNLTLDDIGLPVVRMVVPGLGTVERGHAPLKGRRHANQPTR